MVLYKAVLSSVLHEETILCSVKKICSRVMNVVKFLI